MRIAITNLPNAPQPKGPYSSAVIAEGKFIFVSGQGPYDPATGVLERGSIEEQTERTLKNIQAIVEAAGGRMANVVSCRVFLQSIDDETFASMNRAYEKFFLTEPPTRTTIGCQLRNMDVEIDCIVLMAE